jgi:hypothetical protein
MVRTRWLLPLVLFGALLVPQVQRAGAAGCETVGLTAGAAFTSSVGRLTPASDMGCRGHHPGTDPLPTGMQHCTLSLNCASAPALPVVWLESHEVPAVATVRVSILNLLASNPPEPQAPPPRS